MPAAPPNLDTPLMRQYRDIKADYPHAIVFFHLGDFYEMFGDDAKTASPILGLVLTARQGIAMCGIPVHSASNHIAKLLKAGLKVAIADQAEDPAKAKGLVKRKVSRLITPGTIVEDELLDATATSYLVSVELDTVGWGLACVDVSTGEFWGTQALNDAGRRRLLSLLARIEPAEVIGAAPAIEALRGALPEKTALAAYEPSRSAAPAWTKIMPWTNRSLACKAALRARGYVIDTQSHLADLPAPAYREAQGELQLDETAIRNLELLESSAGGRKHSLWGLLDRCRTAMGSRALKRWILHPSTDIREIERRQNCVEELLDKSECRQALRTALSEIADLERAVNRLGTRSASPRDLAALRDSLVQLKPLSALLRASQFASGLAEIASRLDEMAPALQKAHKVLEDALVQRPPARLSDGGVFREGFDRPLDELRSIKTDSQRFLSELEAREKAATGISSLKIGFNSVFGYYIEISKANIAKAPASYHRKQTLANAERYITPDLKELETKILGAEERMLRLEAQLFERLRTEILASTRPFQVLAAIAAELDVLQSLAEAAEAGAYTKPKVDLSHDLEIEEGRHPMVEAARAAASFVPNGLFLEGDARQILVITGPNMGGKSTYLRQNALIALMAQLGSYVPAKSARIGLVDKILTRIGSQDALARNESTFMVEMRETAHILESATSRSLLILDEVGRGTSTFDGISIAWAVIEFLHARKTEGFGPRTLFATHYFELTRLAELLPGVKNANVEAREWTGSEGRTEVVFLHKIAEGPADRSFGIHVARLAGLPEPCLARAREILAELEGKSKAPRQVPAPDAIGEPELPLFDDHPVLGELRRLAPESMTPLEVFQRVCDWKKRL